ncbi:MAG TPA: hypothetical protein VNR87_10875 [Flavisolibacter sp.]|nr:hypothetical protein [Flavisolibacter sp.]
MTDFFASIDVNSEMLNFRFTRIFVVKGIKFFVTVVDGEKHLVAFSIQKNARNEWKLVPPFPDWLLPLEAALVKAIELHY